MLVLERFGKGRSRDDGRGDERIRGFAERGCCGSGILGQGRFWLGWRDNCGRANYDVSLLSSSFPFRIFLSNYLFFFHFDKMKNKSKKIIATNNNSSTRNNSIHFIKKRKEELNNVINRKYTQVSYILDNFSRISVGYSALEEIFALTLARCRRTLTLSFARESEVDFRGGEEKKREKKRFALPFFSTFLLLLLPQFSKRDLRPANFSFSMG